MDATSIHQKHQKLYVSIYMYTHSNTTTATGVKPIKHTFCPAPKMGNSSFLYLCTMRFKEMAGGNLILKTQEESTRTECHGKIRRSVLQ
jgi:hypothetical protein